MSNLFGGSQSGSDPVAAQLGLQQFGLAKRESGDFFTFP